MNVWVVFAIDALVVLLAILYCQWFIRNARTLVKQEIDRVRQQLELENMQWRETELKAIANKSVQASRMTIKGQLAEQFFPISKECPLLPSDLVFIGNKGFDYLGLDGYTDAKDNSGKIKGIWFFEVKTGKSRLSQVQNELKRAIMEEKVPVYWKTIHMEG